MEPLNSSKPNHSKHCSTWRLLNWLRGSAASQKTQPAEASFGSSAQSALDSADTASSSDSRGSLYRAGMTLADLRPGECGTIRRLFGSTQGRLRLLEMGLTPGTHIKVIRAAAFGGPLDITVRGYQLSLRREEAAGVWLDDEEESAPVQVTTAFKEAAK